MEEEKQYVPDRKRIEEYGLKRTNFEVFQIGRSDGKITRLACEVEGRLDFKRLNFDEKSIERIPKELADKLAVGYKFKAKVNLYGPINDIHVFDYEIIENN